MPVTPLHIGIAVLLAAIFQLDLIAVCLGAVMPDIEGLASMLYTGNSCHGPLHSIIGAVFLAFFVVTPLAYLVDFLWKKYSRPHPKEQLRFWFIALSALVGTLSHNLFDALVYADLNLAWPFAYWNPLAGALGPIKANVISVVCLIIGTVLLIYEHRKRKIEKRKR